jgi:hypothetical protein
VPNQFLNLTQVNHLIATELIAPHLNAIRETHFSGHLILDIEEDPLITFSSDSNHLYYPLRTLLPFGCHLNQQQVDYLIEPYRTGRLLNTSRSQLLYWFLTRPSNRRHGVPITTVTLFPGQDLLWFHYIPRHSLRIQNRLRLGHRTFFLARFTLNFQYVELEFNELRLISILDDPEDPFNAEDPHAILNYRIVYCSGPCYRRYWNNTNWTIESINRDPRLVNPTCPTFNPPTEPLQPDIRDRQSTRYITSPQIPTFPETTTRNNQTTKLIAIPVFQAPRRLSLLSVRVPQNHI